MWTEERVAILTAEYAAGIGFAEIAKHLNEETGSSFSRNAVIGRANRMGLAGRRKPTRTVTRKPRQPARKAKPDNLIELFDVCADHLGIAFADLGPKHCRFPKGTGLAATYCGQPVVEGTSWCSHCYGVVHEQPTRPNYRKVA